MSKGFSPFKTVSMECIPIRLDFRMGVEHSLASRNFTVNLIVKVLSESGIAGYGESVPRHYVTGETIETAVAAVKNLAYGLENKEFGSPEELLEFLSDTGKSKIGSNNPAGFCALELAVLDLAGKHWDMPVYEMIGLRRHSESLTYSMVIPLLDDKKLEYLLAQVKAYGFGQVKVKVDAMNPVERVRRVRDYLGGDVEIRVDANCSWNMENAPGFISELAAINVVSVEQPLGKREYEEMAVLKKNTGMKITLDESVVSSDDALHAGESGAGDIVNVRISKCGGILGSLRVINSSLRAGMGIQLGAQVGESCILSLAGAVIGAGIRELRWREGFFGTHLLEKDLCAGDFQFGMGGRVNLSEKPGLGVEISDETVKGFHENYLTNK